jgi:hypothetical protein
VHSKCDKLVSSFLKQDGRQSEILNDYFPEAGLKSVSKEIIKGEEFLICKPIEDILMFLACEYNNTTSLRLQVNLFPSMFLMF